MDVRVRPAGSRGDSSEVRPLHRVRAGGTEADGEVQVAIRVGRRQQRLRLNSPSSALWIASFKFHRDPPRLLHTGSGQVLVSVARELPGGPSEDEYSSLEQAAAAVPNLDRSALRGPETLPAPEREPGPGRGADVELRRRLCRPAPRAVLLLDSRTGPAEPGTASAETVRLPPAWLADSVQAA